MCWKNPRLRPVAAFARDVAIGGFVVAMTLFAWVSPS